MNIIIIFTLTLFCLVGCTDTHIAKPFECRCDCEGNNFECIGIHSETTEDSTKKYIKEAL